jgi:hypothetical protein
MARFRWFGVVGATVLVVVGCSDAQTARDDNVQTVAPTTLPASAPASTVESATGLALVQTDEGLLTIDLGSGKSDFLAGLADANWTRVASVKDGVARVVDAESRDELRRANVPDGLRVAAISANGNLIAYSDPPEYGRRGLPAGRATTRVAVVGASTVRDAPAKVLDVPGNLVPEAFSTDGRHLFVLDYVPATAPDHYEVRMIDLASGAMTDVGGRLKAPSADEQMQGNVRTSVYSPNREMLFTLYSEYGEEGHAFIHALNLTEKWSYCLDLPDTGHFGDGQATLAMAADNKLYVVGDSGQIAQVDAQPYGLVVERTVQLPAATPAKNRTTATVDGTQLVVGHDDRVFFVDRTSLRLVKTMTMSSAVVGLTADGHGRVAIATATAIDMLGSWADTRRTGLDAKLPVIVRFGLE